MVVELKHKRTYTSSTHKNDDGTFTLEAHVGHIHYANKLKVGDCDDSTMRKCDWTLGWSEELQAWTFEYNNFIPVIPKRANEWIEFRDVYKGKDQKIRLKAVCNDIEGTLVDNKVIYANAFGEGMDLIVYPTRSCLRKEVRIRDQYKPNKDVSFDFEMEIPNDILIDNNKKDDTKSYIKQLSVWNNNTNEKLKYKYVWVNGKRILRKIVTAEQVSRLEGDEDCDTTASYYAGAGDGYCGRSSQTETYAQCRAATTSIGDTAFSYTVTKENLLACKFVDAKPFIRRFYYPVDTSLLPDTAIISSGIAYVYKDAATWNNEVTYPSNIALVGTTQASNTVLVADDYDNMGLIRYCDTDILISSGAGYATFSLNSTGLAAISVAGYTNLGLRCANEFSDDTYAQSLTGTNVYCSEDTSGTKDPYLTITYSLPLTPGLTVAGRKVRIMTNTGVTATRVAEYGAAGLSYALYSPITYTSAYTTDADQLDYFIRGTGTWTLTLATASAITGRIIIVKNAGVGNITIDPEGATLIEGGATWIAYPGDCFWIVFNGTNWEML